MGKHFGNLQYLKGVTYYTLSPYELKPFKGFFNPGFKNFCRIYTHNLLVAGGPFLIGYLVYQHYSEDYHQSLRKNPDEFKDDV